MTCAVIVDAGTLSNHDGKGGYDPERPCGNARVVAVWSRPRAFDLPDLLVPMCYRHDKRARERRQRGVVGTDVWTRVECPQTRQDGPQRPEAVGVA